MTLCLLLSTLVHLPKDLVSITLSGGRKQCIINITVSCQFEREVA